MANISTVPGIDEYLRERLMPVEGAIPQIPGIEMFGNSIPVGTVGGDQLVVEGSFAIGLAELAAVHTQTLPALFG